MSETSEILRTVLERLTWAQNQHKLWFVRVNSGKVFLSYTRKKNGVTKGRCIKLAPTGTPDVFVFQRATKHTSRVTAIETKTQDGELSEVQQEVKALLEEQGVTHLTVRDAAQLDALGLD